ncbi:conserved hypothetical protein [Prochlorococcus marinus str. MIT 9515]|uniref:NAD/FAD-dependent oxidoreductase n=1 Tax=Prochlorococcus marinus (strain MIT 9515) TaxID=167542 RepID=A2BWW5_PROM5|nr:NAD(P)-binding protein [Prochlorococcus marinus]ABM72276.1 conserved hypothetical protein [Prochlorococcus marinus str. MIT 9515]
MQNQQLYDIAIIGGGISSSVFTSSHIKNGFSGKLAIIENGRNLGGRSSTRYSQINNGWELNHGSPNLNICNKKNNQLLKTFIQELLDEEIIQQDTSEFIELNEDYIPSKIDSDFHSGTNYIPRTSMSELAKNIISYNNLRNQVDYFFETLIFKLDFKDNRWILTSKNGYEINSKFLICSSNLILHKRSLDIMKISQTPLRKAIPIYKDKKLDKIINLLNQQNYIKRLTFMIYTNSYYDYKDDYKKKYRYFILNNVFEEKYKFERIIFQRQKNNKLGIVIHTRNNEFINEYFQNKNIKLFKKNLLLKFNQIFQNQPHINKIIDYQDISIMKWRASQPSGIGIPENLQVCESHNIAFCGDWIGNEGFGRMEGAILSALNLSHKINKLF